MGLYRKGETIDSFPAQSAQLTREDIIQYQNNLDYYKSQIEQDRQELEVKLQEVRDAQFEYQRTLRSQDDKIRELTDLVISLTNTVNKLKGS